LKPATAILGMTASFLFQLDASSNADYYYSNSPSWQEHFFQPPERLDYPVIFG
jgi:hypothetical protein